MRGVVIWSHVENDAIFKTKISSVNETFSVQRPRGTERFSGTFSLEENAQGEGWSRAGLGRTFLYQCLNYCQLPKGWTFWGVERFKPAQLHPPSCHVPQTPLTQQHRPSLPSDQTKIPTSLPVALPRPAVTARWTMDHPSLGMEHPWSFPVQGVQAPFLLEPLLLAVMLQPGLCLLLLLLCCTNSNQAQQSPPGAADNRCLIKHLSTLQAFTLTRTKLTLNHSLITAKLY